MSPITDQDLDRLADGELSPAEERELLAALDASPNDWRRCALAFVEAQALRRELSRYAVVHPKPSAHAEPTAAPRRSWFGHFALAASLLLAFGLGVSAPQLWRGLDAGPNGLAGVGPSELPTETPTPSLGEAIAVGRADAPDPDVVTFWAHDEEGQRRSLRTRLVDAEEMGERLGVEFRSALPPELRRRFEERGYRLESHQRYAPLNIDDGRVLVVPVEDMQVQPIPVKYL